MWALEVVADAGKREPAPLTNKEQAPLRGEGAPLLSVRWTPLLLGRTIAGIMKKGILVVLVASMGMLVGGCLGVRGPSAVIRTDPARPEGMQPLTVEFDGSNSYGEGIEHYEWEFNRVGGDEPELAEGVQVTWVFEEAGTYEVRLTVRSADGRSGSASVEVSVGQRPQASFRIEGERSSDGGFYFNQHLEFDASDSTDAVRWMWEFSDGHIAEGETIRRRFHSLREYTVTLVAENDDGVRSNPYTRSFRVVGRCCGQ